jgi:hypothetical protein
MRKMCYTKLTLSCWLKLMNVLCTLRFVLWDTNSLNHEILHLNNISNFPTSQKTQWAPVNRRQPVNAVYCENRNKHVNTLSGQNVEFSNVKVGGSYINHWALKGSTYHMMNSSWSEPANGYQHVNVYIYRVTQESVNWSVKCALKRIRNALITYWIYKKLFGMRSSMFSAQLTTLWYRSTNRLADLNQNIPVETREWFRLTDLWAALHIPNNFSIHRDIGFSDFVHRPDFS